MKRKIIFLVISASCFVLSSCHSVVEHKENKLYKIATSSFSTSSYFLALDVMDKNDTFPIVIENGAFYTDLMQLGIVKNEKDYTDKVLEVLEKEIPLSLNLKKLPFLKDYMVTKNDSIERILTTDKNRFYNHFFTDNWLNSKELSFSQEKAIIYYLFKSNILCKRDCVSGSISIADSLGILGKDKL